MSNRVMVVVAHPDDESFWMGGTISTLARNGAEVRVLALSDGVSSRFEAITNELSLFVLSSEPEAAERRLEQFSEACAILGASHDYAVAFPDQQSDTVPQIRINRFVAERLNEFQPSAVYTHHVGDLNLDHRRVAEAVLVWARGRSTWVYSMRPEWPHMCVSAPWNPNYMVGLDRDAIEHRLAACACYGDEVRQPTRNLTRATKVEAFIKIQ